jgi:hypothetical protein
MKTESKPPHIRVPLRFTYRSRPDRQIIKSHVRHVELPIFSWHFKIIKFSNKETHESAEQAVKSLVNESIKQYIAVTKNQIHKKKPEYDLTITISGEPTYSQEIHEFLELLKP